MDQVLDYNVDDGLKGFPLPGMTRLLPSKPSFHYRELCSTILLVIFIRSDTVTEML